MTGAIAVAHGPALLASWARSQDLCRWFRPAPHALDADAAGYCLWLDEVGNLLDTFPAALLPPTVARASLKCRRHFVAGRLCAERALAHLGIDGPVLRGAAGEPQWPTGVIGSISHNHLLASAALRHGAGPFGLGIDSERIVDQDGWQAIDEICCSETERARHSSTALAATLLFSAKEALYKAIYPVIRRFVGFREVEVIDLDWERRLLVLAPTAGSQLAGRIPPALCRFRFDARMAHTSIAFADDLRRPAPPV